MALHVAHAHDAERSYSFAGPYEKGGSDLYGREDTKEAKGEPSMSFEHVAEKADRSAAIEAFEGTGARRR